MGQDYLKILESFQSTHSCDEKQYISQVLDRFFSERKEDEELAEVLCQALDNMTQEEADLFLDMMERKVGSSWFALAQTILDERENANDYFFYFRDMDLLHAEYSQVEAFYKADEGKVDRFAELLEENGIPFLSVEKVETTESETISEISADKKEAEAVPSSLLMDAMLGEADDLRESFQETRKMLRDLRTELFHTQVENDEIKGENEKLQVENEKLKKEVKQLNTSVFVEKKKAIQKDKNLEQMSVLLESYQTGSLGNFTEIREKVVEKEVEKVPEELTQELEQLRLAAIDYENQITRYKTENEQLQSKVSTFMGQIDELTETISLQQKQISELSYMPDIDEELPGYALDSVEVEEPGLEEILHPISMEENTSDLVFDDIDITRDELKPLKDHSKEFAGETKFFHKISDYFARKSFEKYGYGEQKNMMFSIMMTNGYSPEQMKMVKKILDDKEKQYLYFDLYSLIKRNASLEELETFYESTAAA